MKRKAYKIIVLMLALLLLIPTLAGCTDESDEALITRAEELLEKSKTVNEICFGEGLAVMEEGSYPLTGYLEASKEDCEKYGILTTEDIKALVREVYSVATCDYVDSVIFSPVHTETGYLSYRRYFDATEDDILHLMVKKDYEPFAVGEVSYTNVRVSSHKRKRAEILVDITVTDGERSRTEKDVSLAMRKEDGVWKLDSLSYASID